MEKTDKAIEHVREYQKGNLTGVDSKLILEALIEAKEEIETKDNYALGIVRELGEIGTKIDNLKAMKERLETENAELKKKTKKLYRIT